MKVEGVDGIATNVKLIARPFAKVPIGKKLGDGMAKDRKVF